MVLFTTFILTVFTTLTIAVEVGLVLAVLLFLKRMSEALRVAKVLPDPSSKHKKVKAHMVTESRNCPQISLYTIEGPLFFGTAGGFGRSIMDTMQQPPKVILLRMGKVPLMDTSGEAKLAELVRFIRESGGIVLVTGIQRQALEILKKSGTYSSIGEENFFEHTGEAIDNALSRIDDNKCLGCKHYAFHECQALSLGSKNRIQCKPAVMTNKPTAAFEG
ncbi:putative transporter [compost metagenome]